MFCGRGGGINVITDVQYSVNMYICVVVVVVENRFELSHVMDTALQKCYVLLLFLLA